MRGALTLAQAQAPENATTKSERAKAALSSLVRAFQLDPIVPAEYAAALTLAKDLAGSVADAELTH